MLKYQLVFIKIYKYQLKGTHDLIESQWVTVMLLLFSLFPLLFKNRKQHHMKMLGQR